MFSWYLSHLVHALSDRAAKPNQLDISRREVWDGRGRRAWT
jgi:hypothetical protein